MGHYKADEGGRVNFTEEELNKNNFHPEPGTGEKGRPVFLKPHETIRSKRLFHINEFNIVVSDKISLDRELEDVRSSDCKALSYNNLLLPTTSIIIVFHNEAWSTLDVEVGVLMTCQSIFLVNIPLCSIFPTKLNTVLKSDVLKTPLSLMPFIPLSVLFCSISH